MHKYFSIFQNWHKLNRIRSRVDNYVFMNKLFNIKDTIAIYGSARSGTTWIMDLLLNIQGYINLFEPLHPHWFQEVNDLGLAPKPISYTEEMDEYWKRVLVGKIKIWISRYNVTPGNLIKRLQAKKLIVKSVRANLVLPHISENYETRLNILIVRHPYALIASQLKTGFTGFSKSNGVDYMPTREELIGITSKVIPEKTELLEALGKLSTNVELLAFNWGLENKIPLEGFHRDYDHLLYYEKIFNDPRSELEKILSKIDELSHIDKIMSKIAVPSVSTRIEDVEQTLNRTNILQRWKKQLTETDIVQINDVLSLFDVEVSETDYRL